MLLDFRLTTSGYVPLKFRFLIILDSRYREVRTLSIYKGLNDTFAFMETNSNFQAKSIYRMKVMLVGVP